MAQDVVSDGLCIMWNGKKAKRETVKINRISNLLIEVLKIMKQEGAVKKYKIDSKDKSIEVTLGDFRECKTVKPRFTCDVEQLDGYVRRYLPARGFGNLILSTNKGLLTHKEAEAEKIGGCLMAYFY